MLRPLFWSISLSAFWAFSGSLLTGQIQPQARFEGEQLPILSCSLTHLDLLQNGTTRTTSRMDYEVRPNPSFGTGFVEISALEADLDALKGATSEEKAKPDVIRFKYKAVVTADRSLAPCYALLTFITQGSIGTKLIPIGHLSKDSPKTLRLELREQVDVVGSLHIFANALEVHTNQHRDAYDFQTFYGSLIKSVHGLSAAELLKGEQVYPQELSADGQRLASLRERDGKKNVIVYDLQTMKLLCELPVGETESWVANLTWVSDHELAYVAESNLRGRLRELKLYLLDVQTQQIKELMGDVDGIVTSISDHPEVLVLLESRSRHGAWFEKYNVHTGKTSDLQSPDSGGYMFDRQGNARVQIYNDANKTVYSIKQTPDARWREIDSIVKQPGLHFNSTGDKLLDRVVDVHGIGPDGDTLYVSTRLGSDRFELASFSLSQGVITKTIAKHPRYDLTSSDTSISDLLFAKQSPLLLGIVYEAQKPQVIWFDPKFAAVQKTMDSTFPDHVNWPVDWSKEGNSFVYFSSSDQDPGTYYVFRPTEGKLIPVLERSGRLKGKTLSKTTAIEFAARDGQKIPAYITCPTEPVGHSPLLVIIHGGPMARDHWGYDATNQFFASRGYIVLQVNYRGSSGYGANFQSAGLRARLDTVVLDDIADGVRSLIAKGEVDPSRVAVMGGSFGGWATYMSLIKYPDLYRAGIAIAAVANWRTALNDDRWVSGNKMAYAFWKTILNRTSFSEDEKFIDPYVRAAELKQPILIIHGELDQIVQPTETKLMIAALKQHNNNVQSVSFPYATHTWWPFADRVVLLNESASFLDHYLGKQSSPPTSSVVSTEHVDH